VEYGDLLTVPLDGGLLYVEPVYVRGKDVDCPLLGGVAALYGGRTSFEPTLSGALDALFSPSTATDPSGGGEAAEIGGKGGTAAGKGAAGGAELRQALADAQKALDDSRAAMKKGDWDAYGAAQQRLADALERAEAATRASPATPAEPPVATAPATPPPGDGKKG
jgi:uncharacterized membrane protein (UPF0182 family)